VPGEGVNALDAVSFDLHAGEVLGVAGIAGSGQKELCEVIAGLQKSSAGSVKMNGESILGMTPRAIIKKGISMSFVPEDRLGMGLVGGMDIVENVLLKSYQNMKGWKVNRKEGRKLAQKIIDKFAISTPSVNHVVRKLSGGNIQKVLLGREIELSPQVLITAYPARGLDIGASYNIYDAINEQKKKGVGVLFIGEDLDVLLEISDRIMVLSGGQIADIVEAKCATKEQLGLLMAAAGKEQAHA
jgi:simple sugar transport system ATP-binding protein